MNLRCSRPCCQVQFTVVFGMTVLETVRAVALGVLIALPLARLIARR
jgi:hypothetical protein